mgnify:FL=1
MKKSTKMILGVSLGLVGLLMVALIVFILYMYIGVMLPLYNVPNENKYVTDYDPSMGLVSQATYDALMASEKAEKLELGVNEAGEVVFKHPYKAFGRAKKEYKEVWKIADMAEKNGGLGEKHISRTYYINYIDYMGTVATMYPDMAGDAQIYAEILQIYSNSYNKHR